MSVGTNRVAGGARAHTQQSRLLHVPIRVYHHAGPQGAPAPFDVLHPIVSLQPAAEVAQVDTQRARAEMAALIADLRHGDAAAATARRGDAAAPTCADVVTELARSAGKVSYDIAKDGHLAAVLTLARTRYRLGDAVHAVVRINLPTSRVRIVRLAASLETHEEVNAALAALPAQRMQRHTRQVYATHHESTLDTRQTSVQLTLPRGATPAFATSAVQLHWTLRVSLLTHTRADGGPAPAHIARAHDAYAAFHTAWERTPTLTADGARLEIVEASVPIGVLPSTARTKTVPIDMYA